MGKCNKPIMTVAPGNSFNSGATLLISSGIPSICHSSKLAFNEVTFGFSPHAGATYWCEKLPGDFGTMLLLTGMEFTGKDAINLKLADKLIEIPETYETIVHDVMYALDPTTMPTHNQINGTYQLKYAKHTLMQENVDMRAEQLYNSYMEDYDALRRRTKHRFGREKFIDPRERRPDVLAEADFKFDKIMRARG